MSKLSLDALKERAGVVASEELLNTISGGTANDCHSGHQPTQQGEVISVWEWIFGK
ncbi:MAG: hypothetical protein ACPH4O_02795 [Flavobacteriaceae bacterium]